MVWSHAAKSRALGREAGVGWEDWVSVHDGGGGLNLLVEVVCRHLSWGVKKFNLCHKNCVVNCYFPNKVTLNNTLLSLLTLKAVPNSFGSFAVVHLSPDSSSRNQGWELFQAFSQWSLDNDQLLGSSILKLIRKCTIDMN